MAYVIAESCFEPKDTACVDACPVDCIHPKKNTTYDDGLSGFRRSSTALRTLGLRVLRWTERLVT
jgi:NAD-dependent dihydropyrimidine dehydrogenase PreA subunit